MSQFTTFRYNNRGGLVMDRDSLHESEGYRRQVDALKQLRNRRTPMADLDTLRPEVRAAMEAMDADVQTLEWLCIRAELLRLAKETRILEVKNAGTLANNLCPDHRDKQGGHRCLACLLERAEAELDALKNLQYELAAQVTRANNAEAELAALKARIANSPIVEIANYGDPFIVLPDHLTVPDSLKGKRVRLVVEE